LKSSTSKVLFIGLLGLCRAQQGHELNSMCNECLKHVSVGIQREVCEEHAMKKISFGCFGEDSRRETTPAWWAGVGRLCWVSSEGGWATRRKGGKASQVVHTLGMK
jgi:hypothetical protein